MAAKTPCRLLVQRNISSPDDLITLSQSARLRRTRV